MLFLLSPIQVGISRAVGSHKAGGCRRAEFLDIFDKGTALESTIENFPKDAMYLASVDIGEGL